MCNTKYRHLILNASHFHPQTTKREMTILGKRQWKKIATSMVHVCIYAQFTHQEKLSFYPKLLDCMGWQCYKYSIDAECVRECALPEERLKSTYLLQRIGGIKRAHGCHKAQWIYTRELSRWRACKLSASASASVEQLEECRRGAANRARAITHALRGENTRVAVGVQRSLVWWLMVMIGSLSSYDCHVHYRFKRNVKKMFPPRFRINSFRL